MNICKWNLDEHDEEGRYNTDCGKTMEFNDGSATDNGFVFCPFCGDKIAQEKVTE